MSNLTDPHWDAECRRLKARIRDLEHINASLSKIIDKKDFRDAPENDLPRIRELEAQVKQLREALGFESDAKVDPPKVP